DDVMRVRRLTVVLSHVGGQPLLIEKNASVEEARNMVRRWQRFWAVNGADFSALDGPHRVAAMVKETAYGRWLGSVLRGELGRTSDGRTGLELLKATFAKSLLRFVAALVLGTLLGAIARARWLGRQGSVPRALTDSFVVLASLPVLALVVPLAPKASAAGAFLGTMLLVLWQAALVFAHAPRHPDDEEAGFGPQLLQALALVPPAAPLVMSLVLALECLLGLTGMGVELRLALERGDLHAAIAVTLGCAVFAALSMLLCDALQAVIRPREGGAHD
ncbi:MAG TPA: hypothetical protein VM686_30640, partial [Polyangiaceae bacterium]|nr:hypothetical protein [Polyangiaceae bacterium]